MATYYWVGGTGAWDATTTTNWSLSSGGGGGAGVPTLADNVIFNSLSNATAYTVNVGTNAVAADITIAGPVTGNVAITSGATSILTCYGSWTNAATGVVFSTTLGAILNFSATTTGKTITTNNVSLSAFSLNLIGVGGGWTLGSAFGSSGSINFNNGTFNTANFSISTNNIARAGSAVANVSFGSSVVSVGSASSINFSAATGLTFNAGTSTIISTGTSITFSGGGLTYYNLSFTSNASTLINLTNVPVANNIVFTPRIASGIRLIFLFTNLLCNNIDWGAPANVTMRNLFGSGSRGIVRTLTITAPTAVANIDFRDINYASGTMTGTSLGNAGGNSNITFTAAKTVYWNLAAGGNWATGTAWATTSGGTPAIANFPLAQDTAIIENTGLTAGNTITVSTNSLLPAIDMSTRTANMTLATGTQTPTMCGNFTCQSSGVFTFTGTNSVAVGGAATQTITSNGFTFGPPIQIFAIPGNSVILNGALTISSAVGVQIVSGTLDLANYTLTCPTFAASTTTARSIVFGTGQINVTGSATTVFSMNTATAFTYTGTPTVNFTYSGATGTRTIQFGGTSGGTETNVLNFNVTAGTDTIIFANGTVKNFNLTGFSGTLAAGIRFIYGNYTASAGMTVTGTSSGTTFAATSGTQVITTNGVAHAFPFTFSGTVTYRLADALTVPTYGVTLTSGTLDMFNNTLTCAAFTSSNSNVRSVLFGTAQMYLTGNATTIWSTLTGANFSYTGTGIVNCTYAGSTGQRVIGHGNVISEANTPSFNITAGTDNFAFNANTRAKNLNFTGWGAGGVGLLTFNTLNVYGDLTLGVGSITSATGTVIFAATSGFKTITSNGVIINCAVTFSGVGGTWQLGDGLYVEGTKTVTLTNGTFDANGQNVTSGFFISTGAAIRSLGLSSGTWTLSGAGAAWTVSGTNITLVDGSSTISLSSSSPKTFAGGGLTYGNLYQSGVGNLTITGANTFNALVSLVAPTTVTTSANTVVTNFALSGSGANLVTFDGGSNTISQASGAVGPTNLLIKNSSAIGGAIWTAFPSLGNIDGGNNTGWLFTGPPPSGTGPGFFTIFD